MPWSWPKRGTTRSQAGLREGFRSGLEEKVSADLRSRGVPVLFETVKIPYAIPCSRHTYTPDWRLPNNIIIEGKGRWLPVDRAKHLFVRAQYPDLDIRLVFSSAKSRIAPGSKTTLGDWATSHGFQWAEKVVPQAWIDEPGPAITIEEALAKGPLGYEDFIKQPVKRARKVA